MKPISYGRQHIDEKDIESIIGVLKSDYLTQGPKVNEFEEKFAAFIGSKYAVAVANGTAALHLSSMVMGIKPGHKVITTPITFAASANSVKYCGGEVDFVDIDESTYLIDLDKVEEKLANSSKGSYSGIIPVDFAGYPVNMERLKTIAEEYNLWIIEDACHAPGGCFKNSSGRQFYCGDGQLADLAIFSFHPVKHIATGEGGMITTNNKELYNKLMLLRTHGITKSPDLLIENHGGWYYEMQELGYNYRLSDINAALGVSQLAKADSGLKKRRDIAKKYNLAFQQTNIITPKVQDHYFHAYHLYVIQVSNRKGLYNYLREMNIFSQVHYIPVHMQPYYKNLGWKKGDFPVAESYYEKCLSLPMYPTLSEEEQRYVISKVLEYNNR